MSCFSRGLQNTQVHAAGIPRRPAGAGSEKPGVMASTGTDVGSASSGPAGATSPAPSADPAGHPLAAASRSIWGSNDTAADGVGFALSAVGSASRRHACSAILAQYANAHAAQHGASTARATQLVSARGLTVCGQACDPTTVSECESAVPPSPFCDASNAFGALARLLRQPACRSASLNVCAKTHSSNCPAHF